MIVRRDDLEQALSDVEANALAGASTIVVNLDWWNGLSVAERESYQDRAERADVELLADDTISRHYVEVRGGESGPRLSSERPM